MKKASIVLLVLFLANPLFGEPFREEWATDAINTLREKHGLKERVKGPESPGIFNAQIFETQHDEEMFWANANAGNWESAKTWASDEAAAYELYCERNSITEPTYFVQEEECEIMREILERERILKAKLEAVPLSERNNRPQRAFNYSAVRRGRNRQFAESVTTAYQNFCVEQQRAAQKNIREIQERQRWQIFENMNRNLSDINRKLGY